jgi:hypothetical protein
VFFGIVHPEVMALRVGVRGVNAADSQHLVEQRLVGKSRTSQLGPITPSTTRDHVVDGGESKALMVKVSVKHARANKFLRFCRQKFSRAKGFSQHTFPKNGGRVAFVASRGAHTFLQTPKKPKSH